ncbi:hypothetical protein C8R46DRAFT_1094240 [Mycena filopes]|nr:hypothetical protein C8R46DRAFT_1094240 [Mycena filopes]
MSQLSGITCFHESQGTQPDGPLNFHSRTPLYPQPEHLLHSNEALYVHLMLNQHRGYPLFRPFLSTTLPLPYLSRGVSVGDVGFITENGLFDFLFNIYLPADHAINREGVPADFTPFTEPSEEEILRHEHPSPSQLMNGFQKISTSTTEFSEALSFRSTSNFGAVCGLPDGSAVEKLNDLDKIRQHAIACAESWYHYAIVARGRTTAFNGSLYLITGTEKTDCWGIATTRQIYEGGSCLHLMPGGTDPHQTHPWHWDYSPSSTKGFTSRPDVVRGCKNQTVFLHGFKMGLGSRAWTRALGRYREIVEDRDPRTSWVARVMSWLPKPLVSLLWRWPSWFAKAYFATFSRLFFHPSIILNDYLLGRVPDANSVVIHDDDWAALIREDETELPDAAEMIRRAQTKFKIVKEKGGVYLAPR